MDVPENVNRGLQQHRSRLRLKDRRHPLAHLGSAVSAQQKKYESKLESVFGNCALLLFASVQLSKVGTNSLKIDFHRLTPPPLHSKLRNFGLSSEDKGSRCSVKVEVSVVSLWDDPSRLF